LSIEVLFIK